MVQTQIETITSVTSNVDGIKNITTYYGESPNTAPSLDNITINMPWNIAYQFNQSIVVNNYSDVEGNGLFELQIITLPLLGTLMLNGSLISINQSLSLTDLSNMRYIPQANQFGENYASFIVRVKDNGIPPNMWSQYATITFNVIKDNEEPTVSDNLVTRPYQSTYIFNLIDMIVDYNDIEGDILGYIEFSSIPPMNLGSLLLDDAIVQVEDLPLQLTANDINQGRLKYVDTGEIITQKDILIDFTVFDNNF